MAAATSTQTSKTYLGFPRKFVINDESENAADMTGHLKSLLAKADIKLSVSTDSLCRFEIRSEYEGGTITLPGDMNLSFLGDDGGSPHVLVRYFETLFRTNGYPTARVVYYNDDAKFVICENDKELRSRFFKHDNSGYFGVKIERTVQIGHAQDEQGVWVTPDAHRDALGIHLMTGKEYSAHCDRENAAQKHRALERKATMK